MTTSRLSTHVETLAGDHGTKDSGGRSLADRRSGLRIPVEGSVLIWRAGLAAPQPAQMRDVSAGGAFLETAPLPLGHEIRVEIEGEYSSFMLDAVVIRSRFAPAKGAIAIRFVDRDPLLYAKWLQDECIRLSMWMCADSAPLVAEGKAEIPQHLDDPAFVPIHSVYNVIKSQPSTSLADLLGSGKFDPMPIRIAVARLLESRALTVMKVAAKEKTAPPALKLMGRFRKRQSFARGLS
jgi:hypothetical protein